MKLVSGRPSPRSTSPRLAIATRLRHRRMAIGFTSLFLWTWAFLQDSFVYAAYHNAAFTGLAYPWMISTVTFAIVFAVVGALSRRIDFDFFGPRVQLIALFGMLVGGVCVILAGVIPDSGSAASATSAIALIGGLLIGMATPLFYLDMVHLYLGLKLTEIIIVGAACTVGASLLYGALSFMPAPISTALVMLTPLGMFVALWPRRKTSAPTLRPEDTELHIPWKLNFTALAQGAGFGAGRLLLSNLGETDWLSSAQNLSYIAGYALAAVVLIAFSSLLKRQFDTLIYKIGFPLLALGTLLLSIPELEQAACCVSAFGYRFIDILIWSLVIHLVMTRRVPVGWLSGWSTCCLYLGMLAGQLIASGLTALYAGDTWRLAVGFVAFALMLAALFITNAENDQSAWGTLRPTGETDERPYLTTAVSSIARTANLTNRQRDVLEGLCRSRTKSQIAEDLVISKETVKVHARNIYAALGIHSQQELCALVAEQEARLRREAEE